MDPLSGDRLFPDVEHYCALGDHRTATQCDFMIARAADVALAMAESK